MKSCFHFKILYNFSGIKLVKKELQVLIVLHLKNLQQNSLKWKFIIIRFYFLMTTWNSNTQFGSKITQKIHDKIHEKYYQTEETLVEKTIDREKKVWRLNFQCQLRHPSFLQISNCLPCVSHTHKHSSVGNHLFDYFYLKGQGLRIKVV